MEKPPNPTECPVCHGRQAIFIPETASKHQPDPLCFVCHGAGWVDLGLVCRCGRAATYWHEAQKVWYCGALACSPDKPQPRQYAGYTGHNDFCICG